LRRGKREREETDEKKERNERYGREHHPFPEINFLIAAVLLSLINSGGVRPGPAGARVLAGKGCAPVDELGQNE